MIFRSFSVKIWLAVHYPIKNTVSCLVDYEQVWTLTCRVLFTQMRPGLPADHAQFMPHAAMIPAVTEMQQPYPGIQQQNSHLVSKPRGGSGHVMPSSYMPQSGLQHPPAPTGVDVPINMMSGHQMNGPNHDHQQQPMGHNMSHGPPPRHRNHRAMQNGHNSAPPPRYTLLKVSTELQLYIPARHVLLV